MFINFKQIKWSLIALFIISVGLPIFTIFPWFLKFRSLICILLGAISIVDAYYSKKVRIENLFVLFISSYIICSLYGFFLSEDLFFQNINNMKTVILIGLIIALANFNDDLIKFTKKWIYRIALVNVIWGILQFIWEYYGISSIELNNLVFGPFILKYGLNRTGFAVFTQSSSSIISQRLTGLSWDPFYLGMFSNIVLLYGNNCEGKKIRRILIKFFAFFTLVFSLSRTNLLGYLSYLFVKTYLVLKKNTRLRVFYPFYVITLPFFAILGFLAILFSRGSGTLSHRIAYYHAPFDIFAENPLIMLFGGSPIYGANIYNLYHETISKYGIPIYRGYATIESDIGNILIGRGIIGFFIFLLLFINIIFLKIDLKDKFLAFTLFISGIGYGVTQEPIVIFLIGIFYVEHIYRKRIKAEGILNEYKINISK